MTAPTALPLRPRLAELLASAQRGVLITAPAQGGKSLIVGQYIAELTADSQLAAERIVHLTLTTADDLAELASALTTQPQLLWLSLPLGAPAAQLDELLMAALDSAPELRIIVTRPPRQGAELPRFSAAATTLGYDDLLFTPVELEELYRAAGIALTPEIATQLCAYLGGVPVLVLLVLRGGSRLSGADFPTIRAVAAEILADTMHHGERDAAERQRHRGVAGIMAVCGSVDEEILTAVGITPYTGVAAFPSSVMTTRADGSYALVPINRDMVVWGLARGLPEVTDTLRRLIPELVAAQLLAPAVRCLLALKDWDVLATLAEEHFFEFLSTGPDLLHEVAVHLPHHYLLQRPRLSLLTQLVTALSTGYASSFRPPLPPRPIPSKGPEARREWVFAAFCDMSLLRLSGDFSAAAAAAGPLRDTVTQLPTESTSPVFRATHYLQLAITELLTGNLTAAEADLAAATALRHRGLDASQRSFAANLQAWCALQRGDRAAAVRYHAQASHEAPSESWLSATSTALALTVRADCALAAGDTAAAVELLEELRPLSDLNELWALTASTLVTLIQSTGRLLEAQGFLTTTRAHFSRWCAPHSLAAELMGRASAQLAVAAGDLPAAQAAVNQLRPTAPHTVLLTAQLQLLQRQPVLAHTTLARVDEHALSPRMRAQLCAWDAVALAQQGQHSAAATRLNRAAVLAGSVGTSIDMPAQWRGVFGPLADRIWPQPAAQPALTHSAGVALSPRQQEILPLLAADITLQQIADQLGVSINTIRTQVRGLYKKLGVTSRAAAVATARHTGLLATQ